MTKNYEWDWEVGDKFVYLGSNWGPFEVTEVTATGVKHEYQYGTAHQTFDSIKPYISPKLQKFMERQAPWNKDPEDELLKEIFAHMDRIASKNIDNEVESDVERSLFYKAFKLISEDKAQEPKKLAALMVEVGDQKYRRY